MEPHFLTMTRLDWNKEEVGDKSEYVVKLSDNISKFAKNILNVLNEDYLLNLLNKIAEWLVFRLICNKFVTSIFKCKKIGGLGPQQLQLDCFELKNNFVALNKNSSSFVGCINRMFSKCENIIKVISSTPETIKETYYKLIEYPNDADLEKIQNLIVPQKKPDDFKKAIPKNANK